MMAELQNEVHCVAFDLGKNGTVKYEMGSLVYKPENYEPSDSIETFWLIETPSSYAKGEWFPHI